ncbi:MAG: hypothetical protein J6386_20165 [Candidatus Synoicihabitans palmerolidicus]|nr:hypothetical protein [Candidatus Synoicihabitans palmerolidicus]
MNRLRHIVARFSGWSLRFWIRSRWRKSRSRSSDCNPAAPIKDLQFGNDHFWSVFQSLGNSLGEFDHQGDILVRETESLQVLVKDKSDGMNLFEQSMQLLDQPLAHVDLSLQSLGPLLEQIERCDRHSAALLECQLPMGSALAPLRHMIVFFKIEAAQLDPEHQATFLTVADEIQRLRELIDETFDSNVARLQEVHRTVGKVHAKVKIDFSSYSDRIVTKRSEIEKGIKSMGRQLDLNATRETQLVEASTDLRECMGRIVSALQFEAILTSELTTSSKP